MKIATILDQIDLGTIALPHFQRGFVWNRDQVKGLINSLLGHLSADRAGHAQCGQGQPGSVGG